jgi:phenylacetate-CoA ligase
MAVLNKLIESMPREALKELQERRVLGTLRRVYEENKFYRQLYDAAGINIPGIRTLEDFRRLVPMLDKRVLLADQEAFPPYGLRAWPPIQQLHLTSGTSGVGQEVHALSEADVISQGTPLMYQLTWAGVTPGDTVALTQPWGTTMAGPYYAEGARALGVTPLYLGAGSTEQKIELMLRFQPAALLAIGAYIHRLSIVAESMGVVPARDLPQLRSVLSFGEPFSIAWAERMEQFWNARLFDCFGATQAGGTAMAACEGGSIPSGPSGVRRRGTLHGFDHRLYLEVIEPETGDHVAPGEFGELVVTVMSRELFPCVRFRLGDRIRYLGIGECGCGRAFTAFESGTISRYDDMIKISGFNVWTHSVDAFVLQDERVAEYQAEVRIEQLSGRERVELTVELVPGIAGDQQQAVLSRLEDNIKSTMGISVQARLCEPMTLPRFDHKAKRWHDRRTEDLSG